ncbi:MAG: TRAP transporter large permease subunit [Hyphomicrobiales bacterium]
MMWQQLGTAELILGWDFYAPVILFVVLVALAVPVWAAIGSATILMLVWSQALPLSLVGEKLFSGIDAFALTAVPLFILTGDVLVRTGLSRKFLDVAEALTCWAKGGFGSATVLVCGMFAAISGSDAAGAAAVGRMTIDRLVESGYPRPYACALVAAGACTGILIPPSIAYIIIGLVCWVCGVHVVPAAVSGASDPVLHPVQHCDEPSQPLGRWRASCDQWAANLWKASVRLVRIPVPGIIFYGIFSGRLTRLSWRRGGGGGKYLGFIIEIEVSDFPAMLVSSAKVNGVILPSRFPFL